MRIGLGDREFTPPEISAFILRELKRRAEAFFAEQGEFDQRSRSRGHHRAGVLQRRAAHGDARRRPDRRPRGAAHHQRADRGVAGLRPRQAAHRASSPSTTSAAARSTSRSCASRTACSRCSSTNGDTHLGGDDIDVLLMRPRAGGRRRSQSGATGPPKPFRRFARPSSRPNGISPIATRPTLHRRRRITRALNSRR